MTLCDPDNGMHKAFSLPDSHVIFCEQPSPAWSDSWSSNHLKNVENTISRLHGSIAAMIIEPIVQNAGGLYFYHANYLKELKELCESYNILLILDEIATGFGRTGKMFAYEHSHSSPDILCVGKALTGGYVSLAATLCTEAVAEGITASGMPFMHGPTYMANPLACSAANASLEILMNYKPDTVQKMSDLILQGLAQCNVFDAVHCVRVLGGIGVVELEQHIDLNLFKSIAVSNGVWLRPLNNIIYIVPPYISTRADIVKICEGVYMSLEMYFKKIKT